MDLQIKLEDERLCSGCPFDGRKKTCQGGFVREIGVIQEVPQDRERQIYRGLFGYHTDDDMVAKFAPIRPQSCLLANERPDAAIKHLTEQAAQKEKQTKSGRPQCPACFRAHPTYEVCRKGARVNDSIRLAINDVLTDDDAKVPAKIVAARMDVPLSTLYSYGQVGPKGRDIPINKLLSLVLAAEDARPLAALCTAAGGAFLPLPRAADGAVDAALVEVIKDFGATVEEVADSLKDGVLSADELRRIRRDIAAAHQALAHLSAAAETRARRDEEKGS